MGAWWPAGRASPGSAVLRGTSVVSSHVLHLSVIFVSALPGGLRPAWASTPGRTLWTTGPGEGQGEGLPAGVWLWTPSLVWQVFVLEINTMKHLLSILVIYCFHLIRIPPLRLNNNYNVSLFLLLCCQIPCGCNSVGRSSSMNRVVGFSGFRPSFQAQEITTNGE